VSVAAKHLNRSVGLDGTNGFEDSLQSVTAALEADGVMSDQHKGIDVLVIDRIDEPRLLDHISRFGDDRSIRVASKVEQHTKSHDSEAFLGLKVSILFTNVLEFASAWVSDLDIAGQVLFPVGFGELIEGLVGNCRDVEFVVANGQ
jgi:hypothetical protein